MPQKSQTITVAGYDAARILTIAYGTLEQLGWTIKYAGENVLVARTPRSWNKYDNEISVKTENNQLSVTSKMIHGELFDMMGKNRKHIDAFLAAFESVKRKATDQYLNEWNDKIVLLKGNTIKAAEEEIEHAKEADKVMNFSKGGLYITYGIIAVNVIVFLLMAFGGVDVFAPTRIDIINWGGNYGPLTLSGDWWRLISCVFVHIGIIHIAFNMYALYMVGVYLEPMLGKTRYIVAYLCTGIFASLASLYWHKTPVPSAGASGAIFGMYGVFLALLSTNLIPKQIRNALLQSIGVFVVYNLVYGMKSGIDNAAHVGGLLSGAVFGYLYYPGLRKSERGKRAIPVIAAIAIATLVVTYFYLEKNNVNDEVRRATKSQIQTEKEKKGNKEIDKFDEKYKSIIDMQEIALAPLKDTSLADQEMAEKLQTISLPEWEKADVAVNELKGYKVPDRLYQKAEVMQQYISMRKEQIRLIRKLIIEKDEEANGELGILMGKIDSVVRELNSL